MYTRIVRGRIGIVAGACLLCSLALMAANAGGGWPGTARPLDDANGPWTAPASADRKKNPVPADDKSVAAGKAVYQSSCMACHGTGGKGDGPAAVALTRPPGDLTSAKAQAQSDGALFWKITQGHPPMPAFAASLTDEQRWQVVNFVRTLGPKTATQP